MPNLAHSLAVLVILGAILLAPPPGVHSQNPNDPVINAPTDPPSTTVKSTTIRTEPPTSRVTQKTTLAPIMKTTSKAAPLTLSPTINAMSTKNLNNLFTERQQPSTTLPTNLNAGGSGAQTITSCHVVQTLVSLLTLFAILFLR